MAPYSSSYPNSIVFFSSIGRRKSTGLAFACLELKPVILACVTVATHQMVIVHAHGGSEIAQSVLFART